MKVEIRWTEAADVAAIVADARQADVDEMQAMGMSFEAALQKSVDQSDWTATGVVDDVPVCAFGVAPVSVISGIGAPWMLGANALMKAQVPLVRHCRPVVEAMQASYPRLLNAVDERNAAAKRWLRWLGFVFDEQTFLVGGHAFRVFRRGAW